MSSRKSSKKTPPNTANIKPFVALRIPDVSTGGTWQALRAGENTWGNIRFPDSAIVLKCASGFGKVEVQQTYAADSTYTYVFEATAQIAIISNTFIYFDDHLKEVFRGNLEDYADKK